MTCQRASRGKRTPGLGGCSSPGSSLIELNFWLNFKHHGTNKDSSLKSPRMSHSHLHGVCRGHNLRLRADLGSTWANRHRGHVLRKHPSGPAISPLQGSTEPGYQRLPVQASFRSSRCCLPTATATTPASALCGNKEGSPGLAEQQTWSRRRADGEARGVGGSEPAPLYLFSAECSQDRVLCGAATGVHMQVPGQHLRG